MSSKAKVLCSLCTNTIFSDTYFQHKNRFFKSDWDKKGKWSRKTADHISNFWREQEKITFRRPNYRQKNTKKAAGAALGHGCANSL